MREKPESLGYGQTNDNIFSSKHQSSDDINDLFFKIDIDNQRQVDAHKNDYLNPDDDAAEEYNAPKDIYDVKGFRKEQWHNYPRQLDRLNKYLYEHFNSDKRNLEPDDPGDYSDTEKSPESPYDITSNEIQLDDSYDSQKLVDEANKAAAIMNPLIVLKIHLACLNKDVEFAGYPDRTADLEGNQLRQNENEDFTSNIGDINPKSSQVKVKREGNTRLTTADSARE